MPPVINLSKCQRSGAHPTCLICFTYCPGDVIHIDKKKNTPVVLYADECCHCGNCRISCPNKAITISLPVGMLI